MNLFGVTDPKSRFGKRMETESFVFLKNSKLNFYDALDGQVTQESEAIIVGHNAIAAAYCCQPIQLTIHSPLAANSVVDDVEMVETVSR